MDERRYVKDTDLYPPPRGKVLIETVRVGVTDARERTLSERVYRGRKSGKGEAFRAGLPVVDGFFVKTSVADVDGLEIARDLLEELDPAALARASRSGNKHVRAAAEAMMLP